MGRRREGREEAQVRQASRDVCARHTSDTSAARPACGALVLDTLVMLADVERYTTVRIW